MKVDRQVEGIVTEKKEQGKSEEEDLAVIS